jgi:two-component system chemotaxis sensor kinase CheA
VFIGSDDGRGVDLEAVRRAAQRQGHAASGIQRLGSEELLRLLLKGGISTSGAVTEVSGRGVGLDVVREAVDRLGGEVEVRSEPGRGTQVELAVPLSLSALAVLIVEVAGISVAIPREAVRRTLRVATSGITRTADGESIVHDGRAIPFSPLSRLVNSREAASRSDRPWSVVVVEAGGRLGAVGVDRLVGSAEVVVRRLPALAPASAVVAGASLDVAGSPRLVLDPGILVVELGRLAASAPPEAAPRPLILVVDDSLTTRMLEQSILLAAGYAVDVATSGEEALEMARRRRYALALVDVEMPGIDGFTCIERMRADPGLRDLPTMLVTSRASPEDRRRGEQVGACAYIVKSEFDQNDLLERIRRLVG